MVSRRKASKIEAYKLYIEFISHKNAAVRTEKRKENKTNNYTTDTQ